MHNKKAFEDDDDIIDEKEDEKLLLEYRRQSHRRFSVRLRHMSDDFAKIHEQQNNARRIVPFLRDAIDGIFNVMKGISALYLYREYLM